MIRRVRTDVVHSIRVGVVVAFPKSATTAYSNKNNVYDIEKSEDSATHRVQRAHPKRRVLRKKEIVAAAEQAQFSNAKDEMLLFVGNRCGFSTHLWISERASA